MNQMYGCEECKAVRFPKDTAGLFPYGSPDVEAAFAHALTTGHRVYLIARDRRFNDADRRASGQGGRRSTDANEAVA